MDTIGQLQQVRFLQKSKPMFTLEAEPAVVISTTFSNHQLHTATPSESNLSVHMPLHLSDSGNLSPAKLQLQESTELATGSAPDKQNSR